jgi:hypothetical protein
MKNNWTVGIPIYVTRKNAAGMIGSWTISAWVGVAVMYLVFLNIFAWGLVGLYEAVRVVL